MRWHRALALALVLFGAVYVSLGLWLSAGHGPAKNAFEALRRYDAALAHKRPALAAMLGEKALGLARNDPHWSPIARARLATDVANTELTARHPQKALALTAAANDELAKVSPSEIGLATLVDLARARAEIALAANDRLTAACTLGTLLEAVGPDRVRAQETENAQHPEFAYLASYLNEVSSELAASAPLAAVEQKAPLTSCNTLAGYYARENDYAAASAVSDLIVAAAKSDAALPPELHASLLQGNASVHEFTGDMQTAGARLQEAVEVLEASNNKQASLHAREALGTFLSNWGESARALPILEEAVAEHGAHEDRDPASLAPALVALGYAQLDHNDTVAAEATFRRALATAQSKTAPVPEASADAFNALAELYDSQGKRDAAIEMRASAQRATALRGAANQTSNVLRGAPAAGALLLKVPFIAAGEPSGGRARDAFAVPAPAVTYGTAEVALVASPDAVWASRWPADAFHDADPAFTRERANSPEPAGRDALAEASVLFVPGEGTPFSSALDRAARVQAALGSGRQVALAYTASGPQKLVASRDGIAERFAFSNALEALRAFTSAPAPKPLALIAEGIAAKHVLQALKADRAMAAKWRADGTALVLIAPRLSAAEFKDLVSAFDASRTRMVVYAAAGAVPLLAAQSVYRESPVGLSPRAPSGVERIEWIEAAVNTPAADFDDITSEALVSDAASLMSGAPAADRRCGVARVNGGAFVLNPDGCAAAPAKRKKQAKAN